MTSFSWTCFATGREKGVPIIITTATIIYHYSDNIIIISAFNIILVTTMTVQFYPKLPKFNSKL